MAEEVETFLANGGKINKGAAGLAWQQKLDRRHDKLQRRNKLSALILGVVAAWDPAACKAYLDRHRATVQDILALPRNARRRRLVGLSPMADRHQVAVRLAACPGI